MSTPDYKEAARYAWLVAFLRESNVTFGHSHAGAVERDIRCTLRRLHDALGVKDDERAQHAA